LKENLRGRMNKEINTLIKESAGGNTVTGDVKRLNTFTS
jgi:hypothetical protein